MGLSLSRVLAAAAVLCAVAAGSAAQTVTVESGVYSETQARRGESAYLRACERCHLVDLRGDSAEEIPDLVDDEFLRRWTGRSLNDLFLKVSRTMPATAPGSLAPTEYIDIVAYLLKANRFPSGPRDLVNDGARLQGIVFDQGGVQGAGARSSGPALSALDVFEIRQLNARFVHGLDSAAGRGYMFADVFTAEGVYVDEDGSPHRGREALAEFARRDPDSRKGPTNVRHYLANELIEPTQTGATGRSTVLRALRGQAGPTTVAAARDAVAGGGEYRDDFVRTGDGWRIARRVFVRPGETPAAQEATRAAGRVTAPAVGGAPGALTARDYAEIYQLYARYGYTFDSGADRGYAWANLFTPDGIHVNAINPLEYLKGRDLNALFAWGALRLQGGFITLNPSPPPKNPLSIAHILTSILLIPVEGGVVGKAYRLTGNVSANGAITLAPGGVYFDFLTKTLEGWRYVESWYLRPEIAVPEGAKRFIAPQAAN